ncbi:LysR family transcriptional regulator [Streptomyces sp. URMC 126]|uniref:LysR family transcriptional regulator n=1 Tax=Streptomyces sp. URMC 126 TaxID=3423401 RepID=UPI003F1A9433
MAEVEEPDGDGMSGIELRHLRYFAAVAEAGTVTEAARRLRVAQPSLSQQIGRLERRVGTPLFRRTPHGMVPTEAGRLLLEGTVRAFDELRTSVAAARAVPPTTRVGVCRGVAQTVVAAAEELLTRGRRLRLVYEQADSGRQGELLRGGALAFGILRAPVDTSGLTVRTLADAPLGVLLHVRHPLAERPELTWPDLSGRRLLWFPSGRAPGYAAEVLAHVGARGWTPETEVDADGGHTLFRHRLIGDHGLVALRTRAASLGDPDLVWRPVGPEPPRERLLLAAAARTPWARRLTDAPGGDTGA